VCDINFKIDEDTIREYTNSSSNLVSFINYLLKGVSICIFCSVLYLKLFKIK
jgi:hypothetical protein